MSASGLQISTKKICHICGELTDKPVKICGECRDVYERDAHQDGSMLEAMLWAARRSRWYAERRRRRSR